MKCVCRAYIHLVLLVLVASCAGFQVSNKYKTPFAQSRALVAQGQPEAALTALSKNKQTKINSVLYHLQQAVLLMRLGQYEQSNQQLEQAKQQDDYFRRTSLAEQTSSFVLNDNAKAYITSNYERSWLFALKIINYTQLRDYDGMGVELKQLDLFLQDAKTQELHAFIYYLAGLSYELLGAQDDALISYRKAYGAYKHATHKQLKYAYARMLVALRAQAELKTLALDDPTLAQLTTQLEQKSCVFLYMQGQVSMKRPDSVRVYDQGVGYTVDVPAYPSLPSYSTPIVESEEVSLFAESVNLRVRTELKQALPAIVAKTLTRVIAKKVALRVKNNNKKNQQTLRVLSSLFVGLTEGADLRSWNMLPANLFFIRYYTAGDRCTLPTSIDYPDIAITDAVTLLPLFRLN